MDDCPFEDCPDCPVVDCPVAEGLPADEVDEAGVVAPLVDPGGEALAPLAGEGLAGEWAPVAD